MYFDSATSGGDCCIDQQCSPTTTFNNCDSDTVCISNQCDTTSNTAISSLPVVEFAGTPDQLLRNSNIFMAGDTTPPNPQVNPFPQLNPLVNPFPQVNPQPARPGELPRVAPPFPQPGQGPFPPVVQPGQNPFPPRPDATVRPGDQPIQPGPAGPVPMAGSFNADQIRQILADRDRAIALNRGQKPGEIPGPGVGPMPPSPDGRIPFFPRPDAPPKPSDNKPRPQRTEFLNGEFDEAAKAALDSGRPLVVSFTRPRCGACSTIENETWPGQKGLVDDNAIRVKVDGWQNKNLARQFGVSSYPTTLVISPKSGTRDLQVLEREVGAISSETLGAMLKRGIEKHKTGG